MKAKEHFSTQISEIGSKNLMTKIQNGKSPYQVMVWSIKYLYISDNKKFINENCKGQLCTIIGPIWISKSCERVADYFPNIVQNWWEDIF